VVQSSTGMARRIAIGFRSNQSRAQSSLKHPLHGARCATCSAMVSIIGDAAGCLHPSDKVRPQFAEVPFPRLAIISRCIRFEVCYGAAGRCQAEPKMTMKSTALLALALLTISHPLMAKSHHGFSAHRRHHASQHGAADHSNITCEMVRSYVAQVGLQQAAAMARSAGMTASDKVRAKRCLASRS
jgi:hypothetical protein